jgi:hypothetical protein
MPKFNLHTRRSRIQKLIAEFEQGNMPQARDVALVLSTQQRFAMDEAWRQQKVQRAPIKPAALKAYEQQLKVAAMWQGRLERHKATPPMLPITAYLWDDRMAKQATLQSKADAALQSAKRALVQAMHVDAEIAAVLDRHVVTDSIDGMAIEDMPRCITSRSKSNLANTGNKHLLGKQSIREIKLAALRGALAEVQREIDLLHPPLNAAEQQQQSAKLKHLLARMKNK